MMMRTHLTISVLCCLSAAAAATAQIGGSDTTERAIDGVVAGEAFGDGVATLGDVNGDGVEDIAVGAPFANNGAGLVRIYLGGSAFYAAEPSPLLTLNGQAADDQFGLVVAGDMDLNNDGFGDIAVAARFSDEAALDAGAVFVYFGGDPPFADPPLVLVGEATDDWYGQDVASAGDVNDDGFDDLIVGAPFNDLAALDAGRAYIYFGGDPMDASVDVFLNGPAQSSSHFGWSVDGAGDMNNDGFADVIVGARFFGSGPQRAKGRASVYLGAAMLSNMIDVADADEDFDGEARDDWFGSEVAGVGDVDNDGFDDVVVGAILNDSGASAGGEISLFGGGDPLDAGPDDSFNLAEQDAQLGNAITGADLNGDGFSDVIAAAHFADPGGVSAAGQVFVLFGSDAKQPLPATPDVTLNGEAADDQLGDSLSAAAVVQPADEPSFMAGARFNDVAGNGAGRAYAVKLASCPPDLNGDGVVDGADLGLLLQAWGPMTSPADLNGDGVVDGADLGLLLQGWGACP